MPQHKITKSQKLLSVGPTTPLDIKLGAVTYHTTVNEFVDLLLNLLSALSDSDLYRLHELGIVARQETFDRKRPRSISDKARSSARHAEQQNLSHKRAKKR